MGSVDVDWDFDETALEDAQDHEYATIICRKLHSKDLVEEFTVAEFRAFLTERHRGSRWEVEDRLLALKMGTTFITRISSVWCKQTHPLGRHRELAIVDWPGSGEVLVEGSTDPCYMPGRSKIKGYL